MFQNFTMGTLSVCLKIFKLQKTRRIVPESPGDKRTVELQRRAEQLLEKRYVSKKKVLTLFCKQKSSRCPTGLVSNSDGIIGLVLMHLYVDVYKSKNK